MHLILKKYNIFTYIYISIEFFIFFQEHLVQEGTLSDNVPIKMAPGDKQAFLSVGKRGIGCRLVKWVFTCLNDSNCVSYHGTKIYIYTHYFHLSCIFPREHARVQCLQFPCLVCLSFICALQNLPALFCSCLSHHTAVHDIHPIIYMGCDWIK
jgi:hypothetical protein